MAFDIASLLGGSLGQTLADVIGKFKADPNKVIEMQEMVAQNANVIQVKELELQGKLQDQLQAEITTASANIQAEEKSDSNYTRNARPTFMYIVEAVIAYNYLVAPLFHRSTIVLPDNLMWLFGVSITGYTAFRSFDKFMGLPGKSEATIGSFKLGNTSKGN